MMFKSIALSATLLASSAAEDDGLIRMKLQKIPDHEIVAQHLKAEVRFTQQTRRVKLVPMFHGRTNTVAPTISPADSTIPLPPTPYYAPSRSPPHLL